MAMAPIGASQKSRKRKEDEESTIHIMGGNATVFPLNKSFSSNSTWVYNKRKHKEVKRTFDVARIKNPDDPNQHVDVEVINRLKIARDKSNKKTYQVDYPKIEPSDNVEILQRNQNRSTDPNWGT